MPLRLQRPRSGCTKRCDAAAQFVRSAPSEALLCSGQRADAPKPLPEPALAALCRRRPVCGGGGATADDSQGCTGLGQRASVRCLARLSTLIEWHRCAPPPPVPGRTLLVRAGRILQHRHPGQRRRRPHGRGEPQRPLRHRGSPPEHRRHADGGESRRHCSLPRHAGRCTGAAPVSRRLSPNAHLEHNARPPTVAASGAAARRVMVARVARALCTAALQNQNAQLGQNDRR